MITSAPPCSFALQAVRFRVAAFSRRYVLHLIGSYCRESREHRRLTHQPQAAERLDEKSCPPCVCLLQTGALTNQSSEFFQPRLLRARSTSCSEQESNNVSIYLHLPHCHLLILTGRRDPAIFHQRFASGKFWQSDWKDRTINCERYFVCVPSCQRLPINKNISCETCPTQKGRP